MTKQERLALYKAALKDYRCKKIPFSLDQALSCGFCLYFLDIHQIDVYEDAEFKHFPEKLPELFAQKPDKIVLTQMEWGPNRVKAPRIKALKAAIKMIEDESSTN